MKFVFKSPVNNIPVLGQIMAWRRPNDKPLSKPMVVSLLTHICANRPLWVNMIYLSIFSGSFHWHWAIYDFFPVRMKYSCKNNRPVLNHNNTAKFEPLRWRHNGNVGVSNHQPHHCLLNRLFGCRSKKTSKLRVTGLCAGNHRGPVNSPHKWPVTRKLFPFDDVIMPCVYLVECTAFHFVFSFFFVICMVRWKHFWRLYFQPTSLVLCWLLLTAIFPVLSADR